MVDRTQPTLSAAPCDKCGYNGEGYYQPDKHPCAGEPQATQSDGAKALANLSKQIE